MTRTLEKLPGEARQYCVDFKPKLAWQSGEVLNAVNQVQVDPHPLTVDTFSFSGPKASFWVQAGGVANQTYHLVVRATTNGGRKVEAVCILKVIRPYPDLYILVGEDYLTAEGRNFQFQGGEEWPTDLTGLDITMKIKSAFLGVDLDLTGSIVTATGTEKKVAIELTSADSAMLTPGGYRYEVRADADITLAAGFALVEDPTP